MKTAFNRAGVESSSFLIIEGSVYKHQPSVRSRRRARSIEALRNQG